MADEEAAKARMLADLGNTRRDFVSAPEESDERRAPAGRRDQAAAQRIDETRRARVEAAAAGGGANAGQAARIAAWNNASNFEQDGITNQLENRYSGQGHRAALTRARGYDGGAEAAENHYGEERAMYLRKHGRAIPDFSRSSNNRRAAATKQDNYAEHILGRSRDFKAREMADDSPRGRRRPQVPRSQNPNAAPAPSVKKVFHHDQVVHESGPKEQKGIPAPAAHAFASPSHGHQLQSNGSATDPSRGPVLYNPLAAAAVQGVRGASPSARSRTSTSSHGTGKSRRKGKEADDMSQLGSLKGLKMTTPNIRPALENPAYKQVHFMMALKYAGNPGIESEVYHERFPERKPLLAMALKQLFEEIFKYLKEGDERDLEIYIETHPGRDWMVKNARKAKEVVETYSPNEIVDFCKKNPLMEELVKLTGQHFQAIPRQDSTDIVKRQDSVVAMEMDSATTPTPAVVEPLPPREIADTIMNHVDHNIQTSSPLKSAAVDNTPEPITSPPHLRKRKATAPTPSGQASSSSPLSVKIEHKSAKIDVDNHMPAAAKDAQPAKFDVFPGVSPSPVVAETKSNRALRARYEVSQKAASLMLAETKTNRALRASESSNSSSATKVEPEVAAPLPEMKGTLTGIIYNSAGDLMEIVKHAVAAPVRASMTLSSQDPQFNPMELIGAIESLARSMIERVADTSKNLNAKDLGLEGYGSDEEEL